MKYGTEFTIDNDKIKVYFLNYIDNIPTRFQIFINGNHAAFMEYTDKWNYQRDDKFPVMNEELAEAIGNYLISYFE
jgi:hypothetical protein